MQARSKPVTFFSRCVFRTAIVLAALAAAMAHAATYTWDPDQTPTTGSDDNGTWSAGGYGPYYWSNGTADVAWSSSSGTDTAVFGVGGAGLYTVGVQQTVGVGGITFNSGAYTLQNNYNGAISLNLPAVPIVVNNGATPSISVQLTGTGGLSVSGGSLTLGNPGSSTQNNFTGNVSISNGTISVVGYQYGGPNPGQSPLGDTATAGQTVTINNGGVLQFGNNSNNILGAPLPALAVTTIINSGGSVIGAAAYDGYNDGRGNTLGNLVLNGGTLTTGAGISGDAQQSFYLSGGSVSVTAPSVINTNAGAHNGLNLATTTTFNVGSTGGNPDLSVGVSLWDPPSAAGGGSATLVKTGPGFMQLNAASIVQRRHDGQCRHAPDQQCRGPGQLQWTVGGQRRRARPQRLQPDGRPVVRRGRHSVDELGRGHSDDQHAFGDEHYLRRHAVRRPGPTVPDGRRERQVDPCRQQHLHRPHEHRGRNALSHGQRRGDDHHRRQRRGAGRLGLGAFRLRLRERRWHSRLHPQ